MGSLRKHMKVHGKSPPPSGYDSDADAVDSDSDSSPSTSPSPTPPTPIQTHNNLQQQQQQQQQRQQQQQQQQQHPLSEWYVCQSASGMPTPPSTEHSPIGALTHLHHPITPSSVAY